MHSLHSSQSKFQLVSALVEKLLATGWKFKLYGNEEWTGFAEIIPSFIEKYLNVMWTMSVFLSAAWQRASVHFFSLTFFIFISFLCLFVMQKWELFLHIAECKWKGKRKWKLKMRKNHCRELFNWICVTLNELSRELWITLMDAHCDRKFNLKIPSNHSPLQTSARFYPLSASPLSSLTPICQRWCVQSSGILNSNLISLFFWRIPCVCSSSFDSKLNLF